MRFLLILAALGLQAQTIIDFRCSQITSTNGGSVTAANPAVVTMPCGHGFNKRASVNYRFSVNPQNGDTLPLDGTTYTYVTSLNNGVANQVLIGQSAADTTWYTYNAVNAIPQLQGVVYSTATTAHPTFTAGTSFQSTYLQFFYITPGPVGIGKSAGSSAPSRFAPDTATTRMEWNVVIGGATGTWTAIGTNAIPKFLFARYVSPTQFSLYSNAATSFSTVGFGTFVGQTLLVSRSTEYADLFPLRWNTQSWSSVGVPDPTTGLFKISLPGCSDNTHELECSMSRWVPETGSPSPTGFKGMISAFTVTSGVGTIAVSPAFAYTATANTNVVVGQVVWLRQITDTAAAVGTFTHTISVPNETVTGTATNRLVRYVPGTNTVTKVAQEVGGVIGVCQSGCGTSGTATIADAGMISCVFDNAHTAGHWVSISGYDDRCHDQGVNFVGSKNTGSWSAYIAGAQPLGVVQSTGSAGATENVWWNGLNRAYVVRSINGPANGSNVTSFTINVPYPDGNYNSTTALPGNDFWYSLPAFAASQYTVNAYPLFSQPSDYIYPGFTRMVQNLGDFDPTTTNRITIPVKWGKDLVPCGSQSAMEVGTYWSPPSFPPIQGPHLYNNLDPANYANQWHKYVFNLTPSHEVDVGDSAFDYPNDPIYQGMPFGWKGRARFLDRLGTFYLNFQNYFCVSRDASGQDVYLGPMTMESAVGEPEELVNAREASWSPARFTAADVTAQSAAPSGTAGYDLSWDVPKTKVIQYEMRYSTSASMKSIGFSNGLCQSGTTTCSSADRVTSSGSTATLRYLSSTLAQFPQVWWAWKPISYPLSSTSGNGQNPSWIITNQDLGLSAGDKVTVASVGGNTAVNVTNTALSAVQPRQSFSRFDPAPYVMPITAFTNAGGLIKACVTGQQIASHALITGQTIQVYSTNRAALNAQWTVTVVDSACITLDTSDYATVCAVSCTGGGMRLNLPGTLTSIISNATASPNTVCTFTTTIPHNLVTGWMVYLWGAPDSHLSNADGITPSTYTLTGAPTTTTATFTCPASTPISTTWNTDQIGQAMTVQSWPGVALAVAGNGAYTSGGTIFTTEDTKGFAEIYLTNQDPATLPPRLGGKSSAGGNLTIQ